MKKAGSRTLIFLAHVSHKSTVTDFSPSFCVTWAVGSSAAQTLHFLTDEPFRACHSANVQDQLPEAATRRSAIHSGHNGWLGPAPYCSWTLSTFTLRK